MRLIIAILFTTLIASCSLGGTSVAKRFGDCDDPTKRVTTDCRDDDDDDRGARPNGAAPADRGYVDLPTREPTPSDRISGDPNYTPKDGNLKL